jgi:succinoglycan biosynthesis protein ExoA
VNQLLQRDPEVDADVRDVDVSVLVPVRDEMPQLERAVAAMLDQRFLGRIELLFINGGSQDGSRELLEQLAQRDRRVLLLDNPVRTTPHALNIGLRASRGTYVARMDAHTHYPPDYLRVGVARLRQGDVVSVSGPQLASGVGPWSRRVALALQTPLGVGSARFRRRTAQETEVPSGFTGLWRRDTLLEAGGWDEAWLNDQDTELAARLRRDGGRIVCVPEMAAAYVPRDSLRALYRQYRRYGWYRVKTSHRHPETLQAAQLLPAALVLTLPAALLSPWPVRQVARAGALAYVLLLGGTAASVARRGGRQDAAAVPLVHAVMHAAYGSGFLAGCRELGVPVRALIQATSPAARTSGLRS